MKHSCFLLLVLLSVNALFAYTWSPWGPSGVPIVKAEWQIPAVLSNGHIGLYESGVWNYYTHSNLSVIDFTSYDSNRLMVLLGSGSNSDGVYFFDVNNHNFQLLRWTMNPIFVKYCTSDSRYYVGGLEGLSKTTDGTDWTEVSIPGTGTVTDFAYYGTQFVTCKNSQTWRSPDGGYTWIQSPYGSLIHGYRFNEDGVLYGIINAGTYSDGIWDSFDYGANWNVIEWTLHLSCVGPWFNNNLFFGWLNGEDSQIGVGMTVPGGDYILINMGLTNLNIRCMEIFDLINTPSFWVGTDQGAFYCTGFLTPNDDQIVIPSPSKLINYPNPFSSSTTFVFDFPKGSRDIKLDIYNIRGEKILSKVIERDAELTWNGQNRSGTASSNGIYICKLISNGKTLATRSVLLLK
jgi:hypothetical protein